MTVRWERGLSMAARRSGQGRTPEDWGGREARVGGSPGRAPLRPASGPWTAPAPGEETRADHLRLRRIRAILRGARRFLQLRPSVVRARAEPQVVALPDVDQRDKPTGRTTPTEMGTPVGDVPPSVVASPPSPLSEGRRCSPRHYAESSGNRCGPRPVFLMHSAPDAGTTGRAATAAAEGGQDMERPGPGMRRPVIVLAGGPDARRADLAHRLLRRAPHSRVVVVPDLERDRLATVRPDVVVLDATTASDTLAPAVESLRGFTDAQLLVVSARADSRSVISTLDSGADGYVVAPVSAEELVAHVLASARRARLGRHLPSGSRSIELASLGSSAGLPRRRAYVGSRCLSLTELEWRLLDRLSRQPGRVVSPEALSRAIWGEGPTRLGSLRTLVSELRKKIEGDRSAPAVLLTDRGRGYRLAPAPVASSPS